MELSKVLALWLPSTVKLSSRENHDVAGTVHDSRWAHNLGYKWMSDHRDYTHLNSTEDGHSSGHSITIPFFTNNPFQNRAQLLYTAFLRQLCVLMGPIYPASMIDPPHAGLLSIFTRPTTMPFRLANDEVDSIIRIFLDSGLGAQEDAFSSVIPTLIACQRFPALSNSTTNL